MATGATPPRGGLGSSGDGAGCAGKGRVVSFFERLSVCAMYWYWLTMIGVLYYGMFEVLPTLYVHLGEAWLLCQRIFCGFVWVQMTLNWACVRYTSSDFRPDDHMEYISAHADEISNGGYEINLNHLRQGGEPGNYSLPVQSLRQVDGAPVNSSKFATNTMYIMAEDPPEPGSDRRRVLYPYWSWKPCVVCQVQRPPRAHHCQICNTCVLRRDHHCYFTSSCIGLRNQRHFVIFNLWATVITSYCLVHACAYIYWEMTARIGGLDLLLPITFLRWCLGCVSARDLVGIALLYSVTWFFFTSAGFLRDQVKVILKGTTSFEEDCNMKITCTASKAQNIKGVFGDYWYLNLLVPLHMVFPCNDDGVTWPHVKA